MDLETTPAVYLFAHITAGIATKRPVMINHLLKNKDVRHLAMGASMLVAVLMLIGKIGAYHITGSTAIFSDAAESVVHLFATIIAAFSLWYSTQPPDASHPYGHGKIAYFSVALEGVFIFVAAGSVIYAAVEALVQGHQLHELGLGLVILGGLTLVNLGLGLLLIRIGKAHNTLVLEANGRHVITDMWTTLGVVAGVGLVWATGLTWLDPLIAIVVGLNIIRTSLKLIHRGYHGLMERANAEDTQQIVDHLDRFVASHSISGFHQLRHRRVNDQVFIEVHLMFPNNLSVDNAHSRANKVEKHLKALFPDDNVYITTHLEPENHAAAHPQGHQEPDDPLPSVVRDDF